MEKFSGLNIKKPAEVCSNCEGYCEQACRFGVSARSLLALAQQNMDHFA
jgi:hypothetical protein